MKLSNPLNICTVLNFIHRRFGVQSWAYTARHASFGPHVSPRFLVKTLRHGQGSHIGLLEANGRDIFHLPSFWHTPRIFLIWHYLYLASNQISLSSKFKVLSH
ncbi:hypothetical protein CEXT_11091 [Caerostris extrusa]|uniref:Uncharacterized protein n=1 Tax=Caerostris extrusa TaxID=172846 RepID=A0AAV4QFW1_CAEEX|nr:hypothetical protein CEXT_11091 [Caerostris extrusa]